MSGAAIRPMSLEAFLEWERTQEIAYEFDGQGPVARTGGTLGHRVIADSLVRLLNDQLVATGCWAMAGDVKIVAAGRVRYPDVVVSCASLDLSADIVPAPAVVAEILSPSTARTDRILKLEEYRRTPSIQHYLKLEQDVAEGVLFTRERDRWMAAPITAPAEIVLPELGVRIPIADIYRRVIAAS